MSARERILAALRARALPVPDLPDLAGLPAIRYPDPVAQFCAMVQAVGGRAEPVAGRAALGPALAALPVVQQARQIASLVDELAPPATATRVDLGAVADPHALERLDVLVVESRLGVCENGALWLDGRDLPERAALFITQHVVLVVDASRLVHNLHEAYAHLLAGGEATVLPRATSGYGLWVAGPSKTADIEQSLVIGAHGARSATVLVVTPEPG